MKVKLCNIGAALVLSSAVLWGGSVASAADLKPVQPSAAVSSFTRYCVDTRGKPSKMRRALKLDSNYTAVKSSQATVAAVHTTQDIQVSLTKRKKCSIVFLANKNASSAIEDAVRMLMKSKVIVGKGTQVQPDLVVFPAKGALLYMHLPKNAHKRAVQISMQR